MLEKILRKLGWFNRPNRYVDHIEFGKFTIKDGGIAPSDFLEDEDYFRIVGSKRNDGLYQHPTAVLTDENFEGAVWVMRVPPIVITLAQDYEKEYGNNSEKTNAYVSESFGGYSYTKATDSHGVPISWWRLHEDELRPFRII